MNRTAKFASFEIDYPLNGTNSNNRIGSGFIFDLPSQENKIIEAVFFSVIASNEGKEITFQVGFQLLQNNTFLASVSSKVSGTGILLNPISTAEKRSLNTAEFYVSSLLPYMQGLNAFSSGLRINYFTVNTQVQVSSIRLNATIQYYDL